MHSGASRSTLSYEVGALSYDVGASISAAQPSYGSAKDNMPDATCLAGSRMAIL